MDTFRISDAEILQRLESPEDSFVERKSLGDMKDVVKTCVALANTCDVEGPPGIVFYGVRDDVQAILVRRWDECVTCLHAPAPMAATVMMGGLLEGLLLARINREPNQQPIFTAKSAPKDKRTGNPLPLKGWD